MCGSWQADRARRTLRGIDEQVKKARAAIDWKAAAKRNRFVKLTGGMRSLNRDLVASARAIAVSHLIETETRWSIKKFVRAARC